jgi:hypothetical protein
MLLSLDEMQQFDRARVFLDEDFTAVEKFTVSWIMCLQNCKIFVVARNNVSRSAGRIVDCVTNFALSDMKVAAAKLCFSR